MEFKTLQGVIMEELIRIQTQREMIAWLGLVIISLSASV